MGESEASPLGRLPGVGCHLPVSQVAREAIEARLGLSDEGPRDLPFIGLAESRDSEWSAADLDEFLAQTWADEIYRDAFNRDP